MGSVTYDFAGETVIVTGGSSGIGRAVALAFGGAGATVINADVRRDPKDVDADTPTDEAVDATAGRGEYVETDVSDPAALSAVVEAAHEFGGVDVMVNNAGWYNQASLFETAPEEFERIHAINAGGAFFGCRAAAADMIDRGVAGTIVNTASISSSHAQRDQISYDATKGGVKMITRGAALELADHGIRVNAVAPGQIATEFGTSVAEKEAAVDAGDMAKPIPLDRLGTPDDVAGAVLFLASDAAGYVTGELFYVDGGWQIY
ncbi:SDR family NAD(P)-dependent oxidoreductase [Salinigranum salinum]|uniref:SDR family NAD(P)-dependent oxidoreductase n=1 Tax=Salinigranum salinum TaxID=1364937 RepID=UPI001260B2D8|nr:SDR family NAD(P)-dependent oxidoreductase [Salinigranum salinum]